MLNQCFLSNIGLKSIHLYTWFSFLKYFCVKMYWNVHKFIEIQCPTTMKHWIAKHSKTPSKLKRTLQFNSNHFCNDHFLHLQWKCFDSSYSRKGKNFLATRSGKCVVAFCTSPGIQNCKFFTMRIITLKKIIKNSLFLLFFGIEVPWWKPTWL